MKKATRRTLAVIVLAGAAVVAVSLLYAMTGSVWTTDVQCLGVDLNIYDLKTDVYLNGGPVSGKSPGLPAGLYYVKVTAPDGTVLGKTNGPPVVQVSSLTGRFVQCYQLWAICSTASSGFVDQGYDDTPNPGGEYKAWVSKDPAFPQDECKTDNFKVKEHWTPPPTPEYGSISGTKFLDLNLNGAQDTGLMIHPCGGATASVDEPGIPGWKIELYVYTPVPEVDPPTPTDCATGTWTIVTSTLTDGNGDYIFPNIEQTGYYKVVEVFPLNTICNEWQPTTITACYKVDMTTLQDVSDLDFSNVCYVKGGLTMGYWKNWSGIPMAKKKDPTYNTALPIVLGAACNYATISNPKAAYDLLAAAEASGDGKAMLAAQLLAAKLNVLKFASCNFGCALYAGNEKHYLFWSVGAIISDADAILCDSSASKDAVIAVKDALDEINNNETLRVLLSPGPCSVVYPTII